MGEPRRRRDADADHDERADCGQCDPQPNPFPAATVGAYEGAGYFHCALYRPQFDCRMRALGNPFCAVCQGVIRQALAPHLPAPVYAATA